MKTLAVRSTKALAARHTNMLTALGLLLITTLATAQQPVLPLWPHGAPEPPLNASAEVDVTKPTDAPINGHATVRLTNVSTPTMTVYQPASDKNTGTAALVFPGGGYARLAWTGEGTDVCEWLTNVGITCLLVKYRVPQPTGEAGHYPQDFADLEDAQQAMRLAKAHAGEWHIDPKKIGVIGFSAGGNLAVLLSNHADDRHIESTPAVQDIPGYTQGSGLTLTGTAEARPAFVIAGYPAYLALADDPKTLNPVYAPGKLTPPTFLIAAENDVHYGFNSPLYYQSLTAARVPAELHMYATGGHGFGVHPPNQPEEHWTRLADAWLRSIHMLPDPHPHADTPDNNSIMPTPSANGPATNCPTPSMPSPAPTSPNNHPGGANTTSATNTYQPCNQ